MEMGRTCGQDGPGEMGIRHDSLGPEIGRRNRGRPRRRWDQEFRDVVGNQWSRIARDRGKWKNAFLDIN
jgi:hypothetical protein